MNMSAIGLSFIMAAIICLLALFIILDFFVVIPKFGAEHFGPPEDIKLMMRDVPDKPLWINLFGAVICVILFLGCGGVLIWAAIDAVKNDLTFGMTFLRFLIMLEGYKLFDIVCFDWFLLTKLRLPEKIIPETKGAKGYESFGFNAKSQITKIIVFIPLSLTIAGILSLF